MSPNAPAQLLITPAAASTAPEASDIIPPTTGSTVDMTVRMVFTAAASVLDVMTPVMPMYAVKLIVIPVIIIVAAHFAKRAAAAIREFGNTPFATVTARYAYTSGTTSFCAMLISTSSARLTAANFAPADVSAPPAAAAVNMTGSAAFE